MSSIWKKMTERKKSRPIYELLLFLTDNPAFGEIAVGAPRLDY